MIKQLFLLIVLLTGAKSYAQQADAITGVWQMPDQKIKIRIAPAGDHYQGKLIKASVGSAFNLDVPVGFLGIYILQDIQFERQNKWHGTIYNHRDKKKYACNLSFTDSATLRVRAYKGMPLLGQTMVLARVPE